MGMACFQPVYLLRQGPYSLFWLIVPLKQLQYEVCGDLIIIYPKPYSIYIKRATSMGSFQKELFRFGVPVRAFFVKRMLGKGHMGFERVRKAIEHLVWANYDELTPKAGL